MKTHHLVRRLATAATFGSILFAAPTHAAHFDIYRDGARSAFNTYTDGARERFNPYADGAREKFNPYTDGLRVVRFDVFVDGARD